MADRKTILATVSRRRFMKNIFWTILGGTMTTSGLFIISNKTIAYPIRKGDLPMSAFNSKMFADLVGESFNVQLVHQNTIRADLIEVNDHTGADPNLKRDTHQDCFSILFRAPLDQPLEQSTYNFSHKKIGTFPLFIVPVGIDGKGRLYEAVFNRLRG